MDAVHVIGAGGIGCAVGHALCAAGVAVTFVDADPDKVRWGREHGVAVDRRPARPADFRLFDEWEPPADVPLLLCTKCYDNGRVLARVPAGARLLPIQNGFDPALHARAAAEGIASFVSECLPGRTHTRITRRGRLHLGPTMGEASRERQRPELASRERQRPEGIDLARALAARLAPAAPFRVAVVEDIRPYKYTKLMYNAAISPLAAAAGLDNGELLRRPRLRRLFFDLIQENYAILRGAGVVLGKVGPFHPHRVAAILSRPLLAGALAWAFYPSLRRTYCSMSGDLPRGRSEIDYYNRHLIDLAGATPCPLNRRVYALVKRLEHERARPDPAVLEELLRPEGAPPARAVNP